MELGEIPESKREYDKGDPPILVPPAALLGNRDCFEQGERFPLPVVDREFIDNIDSRCFDLIDARELAWLELSSIDRCSLQKFYAFVIDLMYANDEGRIIAAIQALIGPGYAIRFHRPVSPLPGIVTIISTEWAVAIVDGTRLFQQLALQAFESLGGPEDFGFYRTARLWRDASFYLSETLDLDGMVPNCKITLVGHSYGAAALCVAAARYHIWRPLREIHLLTFGSPKPGDARLAEILDPLHQLHLQGDTDLVTLLAPDLPNLAPYLAFVGINLATRWNSWKRPPHCWRLDFDGELRAPREFVDDYEVLLAAIVAAIAGDQVGLIAGHYIESYFQRLNRKCPLPAWPVKAPIPAMEAIAIGSLGLPGTFPQAPGAADGSLQLRGLVEMFPAGQGIALAGEQPPIGGLALTAPVDEPIGSIGAIALAGIEPDVIVGPCGLCPTMRRRYTFTVSTAVNGTCTDAANLNRVWTLVYSGNCIWYAFPIIQLCASPSIWGLSVQTLGTTWQLNIPVVGTAGGIAYSIPVAAFQCLGTSVMLQILSGAPNILGMPPAITINPL